MSSFSRRLLLYGALILLTTTALPAQNRAWIDSVISWTINGYFTRAEDFLNKKIARSDSALIYCFYLSSVYNSRMTHFENLDNAQTFERLLHSVIRKSNALLDQSAPDDQQLARLYFYRGSAYGYLAYFQGQTGQWLKALTNGLKAIKDLQACTERDSTFYEAYLGLGTYKYWRSTKLKAVLWLPFLSDRRKEGIADLKRALSSPSYARYMAMHQLIYILIDYGQYEEALNYARQAIARFPKSQFMWWAYAHVYFKSHNYPKALKAYRRLLQLIENHPESNPSHWLDCQVRIAEMYRRMGRMEQAHRTAQLILEKQDQFPDTKKNRERLAHAEEILRQH